jgi:hypothetical protein
MTPLNSYPFSDDGVLRTDKQPFALLGLTRLEFERGLGQHMTAQKSDPDFVVYGPISIQLWGQRFVAGVRFFGDVIHGVTLTLEQSKVAALGYDATEKDLLAEKKTLTTLISKQLELAFIDITRRRLVRIPLGRHSVESRFKVDGAVSRFDINNNNIFVEELLVAIAPCSTLFASNDAHN